MFLRNLQILFLTSISFVSIESATAESLKFITAPTHSKQQTREIYTPIVKYLSEQTGKNIELVLSINFLDYVNKMRGGSFDITFDGPHFSSWRIKNLGDTPVARFPGEIKIAIATTEGHSEYRKLDDLVGRRVCAFASPNLLTMAYLNNYPNPLRLPVIIPAKGFKGLVNCLKTGKGKAVVLRDKMWNKMDKSGLKLISIPDIAYPDRTFTVSKRIDQSTLSNIRRALLADDAKQPLSKLLRTFKKPELIATTAEEYKDIDQLLNSIWAFKSRR